MYMTTRVRMSSIMELIGPELSELSALELENLPYLTMFTHEHLQILTISNKLGHNIYAHTVSDEFDYGSNWTRTSGVICPWIWKNCWIWLCLHSSIYKYWPINTKLGQNICDYKTSYEFDYGSNRTRTDWVICPWIKKFAIFDFVYTLVSANIDQSVPNLATIYIPIKSRMSLIMGQIESEHPELFALKFEKIAESDFVYTLASTNINQSAPNLVKMYMTIRSWMS